MKNEFVRSYSESVSLISNNSLCTSQNPILVVDDETDFHLIINKCYQYSKKTNKLILFSSGDDVLSYMDGVLNNENATPCLILMDINMPGMNGFTLLEEIKKHGAFKDIPIVFMLSNSEAPEDVSRAKQTDANGYLVKSGDLKTYIEFFKQL